MCQYAWFTHSWLLHDIPSLFYTISCGPADAADRLRITVKRLRGPAPGVEDSIMSSFVNDESTWRRTGRPEMTARSCRRLGGALMPGPVTLARLLSERSRPVRVRAVTAQSYRRLVGAATTRVCYEPMVLARGYHTRFLVGLSGRGDSCPSNVGVFVFCSRAKSL